MGSELWEGQADQENRAQTAQKPGQSRTDLRFSFVLFLFVCLFSFPNEAGGKILDSQFSIPSCKPTASSLIFVLLSSFFGLCKQGGGKGKKKKKSS